MLTNGGARDAQTLKQVLTMIVDQWLSDGYLESNQPIDFTFTAESVNEATADQITDPDEAAGTRRTHSSVTVIRIPRDELARDPFRYVSDPPRLPKEPIDPKRRGDE